MRKLKLLLCFVVVSALFSSCFKEDEGDREKIVEMTIYPETGFGGSVMSEVWTEPLMFSDSEDSRKRILVDILFEGSDNFTYERGYEYTLKVKKIWMQNPPQDASSVKYVLLQILSKEKVITENTEKNIEVTVSDKTVKFVPRIPTEYEQVETENGENYEIPKVYDAMYLSENGADYTYPLIVTEIEGFDYEEGYEHILTLKKKIQAEPYAVEYSLIEIIFKEERD
jgi:hypothetical protein